MNEMLLQFIWQYSLYQPQHLATCAGEPITVISPGTRNTHAGPDFLEARIRIDDTTLVGNIELHVNASDWDRHGHQHNRAYSNIILHVVYRNDNDSIKPQLELAPHIPAYVIDRYTHLLSTRQDIPCARQLQQVKNIVKESWLNRLLAERWEQKLGDWQQLLQQSAGDWRSLLYWRMAANFGFKVNAQPFLMLAQSLPLNVLAKHHGNLPQLEALLFGQSGLLRADYEEAYPASLYKEYAYLRQKYQLQPIAAHLWKFMRLRPASFPTLRIAQFAALLHRSQYLFARILESPPIAELHQLLDVTASAYWDNHYRFDEAQQKGAEKHLGAASADNIIINTIAPIQFLYAYEHGLKPLQEQALQLLESVKPEDNNIIRRWADAGWQPVNAAQSQAQLQLFNHYCNPKRCLECAIGLSIVRSSPVN